MPLIRKSASDVTTYRRVSATNLPVPAIKSSGYTPPFRNIIASVSRASVAAAGASPGNTVLQIYGGVPSVPPTPPPPSDAISGSLYFDAFYVATSPDPSGSWIYITNPNGELSPATGDFTVEWWQFLSTNTYKKAPTVFNLGAEVGLTANRLRFTLDGLGGVRTPTVYVGGMPRASPGTVTVDNSWAHFAIVRSSGTVTLYLNGTDIFSFASSENIVALDPVFIGTPSLTPKDSSVFEGNITNFRWVLGEAVYTSNFTPSLDNLPIVGNKTKLLLLAKTPVSAFTNTAGGPFLVNNIGVTWDSAVPS